MRVTSLTAHLPTQFGANSVIFCLMTRDIHRIMMPTLPRYFDIGNQNKRAKQNCAGAWIMRLSDEDACWGLFLLVLLLVLGGRMTGRDRRLATRAMRIALAVFFGFVLLRGYAEGARSLAAWGGIALMGVFVGAFALGVASILLPLLAFAHHHLVAAPAEHARDSCARAERRRRDEAARREAEQAAARERARWEQEAPERERQRRQEAEAQQLRAEAQRRRNDARADARLHYRYYCSRLGAAWFPEAEFTLYLDSFMHDSEPPEIVERHGQRLLAMFERKLTETEPAQPEQTIEGLTAWYRATQATIERSPLDERSRRVQMAQLYTRYSELLTELLERMTP